MKRRFSSHSHKSRILHQVRLLVFPHAHNDFHPHLIRWYGIAAIVLSGLLFQFGYNYASSGSVLGRSTDLSAAELLNLTNDERTKNGERPLALNRSLSEAAQLKADDMNTKQYWAHTSPDGVEPWEWFDKAGYDYQSAGENLARGFVTSPAVVTAWMNSEEHKANILDKSYTEVGFAVKQAVYDGKQTNLVVALYGAPKVSAGSPAYQASEPNVAPVGFVSRIGIGVQSMTPALLGSLVLLAFGAGVALLAHTQRRNLPHSWKRSFMKHHGAFKALGMTSFAVMLLALYGTGQI